MLPVLHRSVVRFLCCCTSGTWQKGAGVETWGLGLKCGKLYCINAPTRPGFESVWAWLSGKLRSAFLFIWGPWVWRLLLEVLWACSLLGTHSLQVTSQKCRQSKARKPQWCRIAKITHHVLPKCHLHGEVHLEPCSKRVSGELKWGVLPMELDVYRAFKSAYELKIGWKNGFALSQISLKLHLSDSFPLM